MDIKDHQKCKFEKPLFKANPNYFKDNDDIQDAPMIAGTFNKWKLK